MRLLDKFSDRERRLFFPAAVAAVFLSSFLFVDLPLYGKIIGIEKKIRGEEKRLNSLISTGKKYLSIKNELDNLRDAAFRGEGASLTGIDAVVSRSGLKKKLSSLKPAAAPIVNGLKKIKAELSFDKLSLLELSTFVAALEAEERPIFIERLSLKATYEDPSLFNTSLVVNTVERE